jgi:rsbT co-antagonist protein RsbR
VWDIAQRMTEIPGMIPRQQQALGDFWTVYEGCYEEVQREVVEALSNDDELRAVFDGARDDGAQAGGLLDRDLIRRACLDGDWEALLDHLHGQGSWFAEAGIGIAAWFRIMAELRARVRPRIRATFRADLDRLSAAVEAMEAFADVALFEIARAYLSSREQLIRRHQQAILEISTPVLQIRQGLLILPLIGMIDSQRARNLTDQLLLNIRARRAKIVVLDLTGVPAVDSAVANHLMQTVQAARLLGARGIVTGLSAENAQTLVRLGVNLGGLTTLGDLEDGIKLAERYLGYRLVLGETQGSTGVGEG